MPRSIGSRKGTVNVTLFFRSRRYCRAITSSQIIVRFPRFFVFLKYSFHLPGTSRCSRRWFTCLRITSTPSSHFTLYESGQVLLSMCVFFHLDPGIKFLTRTLSPLSLFLCVLMLHLLWKLLNFHALSDVWSNEIQSRSQAAVEQQLCWCHFSCCLGCWSIRQQESAEFDVYCAWRSFQFLHSVFENTDWFLHQAIRRWCLGAVFTRKIPFLVMKSRSSSLGNRVPLTQTTMSSLWKLLHW